jgi:hypothetical protein
MKSEPEKNENPGFFEATKHVRSGLKPVLAGSHFPYSNLRTERKDKGRREMESFKKCTKALCLEIRRYIGKYRQVKYPAS